MESVRGQDFIRPVYFPYALVSHFLGRLSAISSYSEIFQSAGPILRRSLLIQVFRSSTEVTRVLHTLPFICPDRKKSLGIITGDRGSRVLVLPAQSSYWVSYDSSRLFCDCKSVNERHPAENCSLVSKTQSEETHNELACSCSFHREHPHLGRNRGP